MKIRFLNGAEKEFANLCGANLCEANLYGANLCGADLREANLCGADLREANLYEANLRGADLREANLCGAGLCGANLCEANLCGADLRWADLRWAGLCGANLCEIKGVVLGPQRSDGYLFWLTGTRRRPIIRAGCRKFEGFHAARQHWDYTRGGTPLGDETIAILNYLESRVGALL